MPSSDQENNYPSSNKRRKKSGANPLQPISMAPKRNNRSSDDNETIVKKSKQSIPAATDEEEGYDRFRRSSAGVVKRIKLVNFMCHANFEMLFNPRINFVSGCNGSGKSAIQTGLVIGLGGVASKTNRSSKIHGLVKHGCHTGSVSITLSNNGQNAYKSEEYGNAIEIVRTISPGSSTYKIYNQWRKPMASTKKELESILAKFRIEPSNPVAILNQDMARNFLSSNKAEDKYTLFSKATRLDLAESLIMRIASDIVESDETIEVKRKAIAILQQALDQMQKKIKLVEAVKTNKEKKFALENELAWSKVIETRDLLSGLVNKLAEQDSTKAKLQKTLDEVDLKVQTLTSQKEHCDADLAGIEEETRQREDTHRLMTKKFQQKKKLYGEKCLEKDRTETNLRNLKLDKDQITKTLDDIQKKEIEIVEKKQANLLVRGQLQEKLDIQQKQFKKLEEEEARFASTFDHYKEQVASKERRIRGCEDEIAQNRRIIDSVGKKSDDWSGYDSWMPKLVQKVNEAVRANKFSKPPRGPLGRYIKVKEDRWRCCIESNLTVGFFCSFLVNDANDRRVLYSIMDQVVQGGRKPGIHCSRFQEGKRDSQLPRIQVTAPGYPNMLQMLTINDPAVANFYMDYKNIHTVLLVDDNEACRNFVEHDKNIPRNCSMILNLVADQFLPGYRMYSNTNPIANTRILKPGGSNADQVRIQKEAIKVKENEIARVNEEIEEFQRSLQDFNEKRKMLRQEMNQLKMSTVQKKRKIDELTNEIETEMPSLQLQLEELKNVEDEIAQLEEKSRVLAEEKTATEEAMKEAKDELKNEQQNDFFAQQTQLNANKDKITEQLKRLKFKVVELNKNIEELKTKGGHLGKRIDDTKKELADKEELASELCKEQDDIRTVQVLKKEIRDCEIFIEEARKGLGGEENDFQIEYMSKSTNLKETVDTFNRLVDLHVKMKRLIAVRKKQIENLRGTNASIILVKYQTVLQSRNYRGKLVFNHAQRKLEILGASIDGGDAYMNINSLSGGEKSYATVAFLLALWDNMDLPFYSMDEYDVFMDAINRKTITELLMEFAKKSATRQFIFLTPLDVSILKLGRDVQVHKVNKVQC